MDYFISDLHLGHDREFLYVPRGFKSIEEHDKAIIDNWNSIITDDDNVYILGDLIMGDQDSGIEKLKKLKGNKYFVIGNHDTDVKCEKYKSIGITCKGFANIYKYKKYRFYISHYPTMTSNMDNDAPINKHTINLSGHTHSKEKFYNDMPFIYNVACEANNCAPISIEDIIANIKMKIEECKSYL